MIARGKLEALLWSLVATQAEVLAAYDAGILAEHTRTCRNKVGRVDITEKGLGARNRGRTIAARTSTGAIKLPRRADRWTHERRHW